MSCSAREPEGEPEQPGAQVDPDGVEAEEGADDGEAAQLEDQVGHVEREHRPYSDNFLAQWQRRLVGEEGADASLAHHYHRHPDAEQLNVGRLPKNIFAMKPEAVNFFGPFELSGLLFETFGNFDWLTPILKLTGHPSGSIPPNTPNLNVQKINIHFDILTYIQSVPKN